MITVNHFARANQAGNITLDKALEGLELSVVFLNYSDPTNQRLFTLDDGIINPNRQMLLVNIMDELSRRAGFTWRDSFGVVQPIDTSTSNHTYTDLLDWQAETYDISAGRWDKSLARIQRSISFPEGFYDASMILVQDDNSKAALQIWSVFLPFRWTVWAMTLATIIASGLVYWFLERLNNKADQRQLEHKPGEAIFYTALSFTGHMEFRPRSAPAMIMTFSLTFASLLFSAIYTANLASFLVLQRQPKDFVTSIAEAAFRQVPICLQDRINSYEYIRERYPDAILKVLPTSDDVYASLRNNTCQVAIDTAASFQQYKRSGKYNADCRLTWNSQVEDFLMAGFATAVDSGILCTSLISSVLDFHFLSMEADGFFDRQWRNHLNRIGASVCGNDQNLDTKEESIIGEETFSLGLREMAGIYIIHAFLMGFALILALLKRETKKQLSKRSMRREMSKHVKSNSLCDVESSTRNEGGSGEMTNHENHVSCLENTEVVHRGNNREDELILRDRQQQQSWP